jgi:hypothetical protein
MLIFELKYRKRIMSFPISTHQTDMNDVILTTCTTLNYILRLCFGLLGKSIYSHIALSVRHCWVSQYIHTQLYL